MASRTMVTVGTDGFRDYVDLPDGRTFNLGTTSILRFVVELAEDQRKARKALDQFLKNRSTMLSVDLDAMVGLIQSKRSRWAGHKNRLMASTGHSPMTFDVDHILARLGEAETLVASLSEGNCGQKEAEGLTAIVASFLAKPAGFTPTAAVDEDLKEELALYLDSETRLNSAKKGILQNILRKLGAKKYDANQAWKLWMFWVDEGVKMYARQFKVSKDFFPKDLRESLAKDIARQEKKRIDEGEYTQLRLASEVSAESAPPVPAPPPVPVFQPSPAPPMVGDELVTTVMAQIETSLQAVSTSKKANTDLAKKDLYTISSMLVSSLQEGSEVSKVASDLRIKAAKIEKHFAS